MEYMSIQWVLEEKGRLTERPDWKVISSKWDQLTVKYGVLCRRWESDDGRLVKWRTVLPEKYRLDLVRELHGGKSSGHLWVKKTTAKVCARFYWSGIHADVRSVIRQCNVCAKRKSSAKARKVQLQQHAVGTPMQRVALAIMGPLPESDKGNKYILVVGDYLSKWMEAYPIPEQTATTVAEKFVNEFVCRFGVPDVLHQTRAATLSLKYLQRFGVLSG